MHCGTPPGSGGLPEPFVPFGSPLSQQERKSMPPRRGRGQRPTRAQGARRVRGAFDRTPEATPWARFASTLRRRTRFYRARQMADGGKGGALSANPHGFRAHRRFARGWTSSMRIRTRPRAAVGSARAITPTYPCLGACRSFLAAPAAAAAHAARGPVPMSPQWLPSPPSPSPRPP